MTIRPYQSSDLADILRLLRQNTPTYFAPEEEADLIDYLQQHAEQHYVYEADSQVLGCAGYAWREAQTIGWLSWFIVDADRQGEGIGQQLLDYCINNLRTAPQLEKIVVRTTQLVDSFFAKAGFKLVKQEKDYWAPGFDLYYMEMN